MRSKLKVWIEAARLRTLPLSISGILVGNGVAFVHGHFSILIFVLSLFTTIAFQVLSNLANDYGDGVKGTDNDNRIGPARALQQGLLSRGELKRGLIIGVFICLALTLALISASINLGDWQLWIFFLILGGASITAAITYTVGKRAYGYFALGDLFVFLFFGLVSVMGSYFLQTKQLNISLLYPAISVGCFSTAVLNLNNMRDRTSDRLSKKITLPVLLGITNAKRYHFVLIFVGFLSSIAFVHGEAYAIEGYFFLLLLVPFIKHLTTIRKITNLAHFDKELKKVALSTFFFSLAFIIGIIQSTL